MVILRENVSVRSSQNILLRADAYETARMHTVLTLQEIKTDNREIKIWRIVLITNTQGDHDIYKQKPYSFSGIYRNSVMEA